MNLDPYPSSRFFQLRPGSGFNCTQTKIQFIIFIYRILSFSNKHALTLTRFFSALNTERDQLAACRTVNLTELKQLQPADDEVRRESLMAESRRLRDRWEAVKGDLWRLEESTLLAALRLPNSTGLSAPSTERVVHKKGSRAPPEGLANRSLPRTHAQLITENDLGEFSSNR